MLKLFFVPNLVLVVSPLMVHDAYGQTKASLAKSTYGQRMGILNDAELQYEIENKIACFARLGILYEKICNISVTFP